MLLWQLYTVIMASQSDRRNKHTALLWKRSVGQLNSGKATANRPMNIGLIKTLCNQVKCKIRFAKATDEQVALMALRWSPPFFFFFVPAPRWAAAFVACGLRPGWYMTANCCLMHSVGHIGGAVTLTVGCNGRKCCCTAIGATLHR